MTFVHRIYLGFLISLSFVPAYAFDANHVLKGTTLDYPPYEYMHEDEPRGLAIELLQEAVKRTGIKGVDIDFFPWKRAVNSIEFGDKEVIFNAGKNEERQKWGTYADEVIIWQRYHLFARKGSNIETDLDFENLGDKEIAIRNGYLYGSGPFKKAITTPDVFKGVSLTDSTQQSVRLLLGGRVDLFVGDYFPVMHYIIENGLEDEIEIVQDSQNRNDLIVLKWPTYFLFSKKNVPQEYIDRFNLAMQTMINDGTFMSIHEKYDQQYGLE